MEETTQKNEKSTELDFTLTVTEDNLKVLLSCKAVTNDVQELADAILARLGEMKIKARPENDKLLLVLNESRNKTKDVVNVCIAEGIAPIMPIDGKVEWTGDYFNEGYYIDPETKRVDFHRRAGNPDVEKDQLLVRVRADRQGKPGQNVFGQKIDVSKARQVRLEGGANVVWDEKEHGYRAKCCGRVRLKRHVLDVDEILYLKSGVNNDSGNVKHSGQVIIEGDIDSEFSVEVTGNVEVRGLIYACDLKCGGSLIAKEGINENPARRMIVGQNILTKYILNANIEAVGNVVANREIFQSQVKTSSEIQCRKGRILGGEVMAARGIYVGEAGSKGSSKTVLIAGIDYRLQNRLKRNKDEIKRLKDALGQLKPAFGRLDKMRSHLKPEQKESLTELSFKITEAEEQIENIENENKQIRKAIYANKKARIVIYDMVYPGVVLRVFDSQYVVEEALMGPIVAELDPVTGEICLSSNVSE